MQQIRKTRSIAGFYGGTKFWQRRGKDMATYYKLIQLHDYPLGHFGVTEEIFSAFNWAAIQAEIRSLPAGVRTYVERVKVPDSSSDMKQVPIKCLKHGTTFSRKTNSRKTYTRSLYDRELKKFCCNDDDDISRNIYLKGSTLVFIEE